MRWFLLLLIVQAALFTAACELVGNIFQAGMWVGIILVTLIVIGVAFVAGKIRR